MILMLLNMSNSRFQKLVIALWHHGGGAWHSVLFLTTANNVSVAQLCQVGDTQNFKQQIMA